MLKAAPQRFLILGFGLAILIGAGLLYLPVALKAGAGGISFIDSLFTSTSAVCVTGLTVVDPGSTFTVFGRWSMIALMQAGGLGIMTFSTLFAVILGRRISLRDNEIVRSTLEGQGVFAIRKLIFAILGITLAIEFLGALGLFIRWGQTMDWTVLERLEQSIFHSVAAFCNAGFSLFRDNLMGFRGDVAVNIIIMLLIIFGGIGFIVIINILEVIFRRRQGARLNLQSRIAITASIILIFAGALVIFLAENNRMMSGMPASEKILSSFFQSVTARTAGFNTLSIGDMSVPSLMMLVFLMFIGASPGSTGGGIKTCTSVVLLHSVANMFQNNKRVHVFNRSVSQRVIRESFVIFFISLAWIFVFTMIIAFIYSRKASPGASFMDILFEVTSAFGTVGLSTGITPKLDTFSKICVIITMFLGRIGPLTIALSAGMQEMRDNYTFPEENIMVG